MKELTAEDFGMQFDAEHYFSFIETEDAVIMAWGHDSDEALLDQIYTYDLLCVSDANAAVRGEPEDLSHVWAVRIDDTPASEDQDEMWSVQWAEANEFFTDQTPNAFPITIWSR